MIEFWSQVISESSILLLALIFGIASYNKMEHFNRILFWQLSIWIGFYLISYGITTWQTFKGYSQNNHALMNIHLVVEGSLLLFAAHSTLESSTQRWQARVSFLLFIFVFLFNVLEKGLSSYSHYTDLCACFLISYLFTLIVYQLVHTSGKSTWSQPSIYASIGILAYFACSIPYIAMMGYLQIHAPKTNALLFHLINDVLANMRYLLLAISFWMIYKSASLKPQNP